MKLIKISIATSIKAQKCKRIKPNPMPLTLWPKKILKSLLSQSQEISFINLSTHRECQMVEIELRWL